MRLGANVGLPPITSLGTELGAGSDRPSAKLSLRSELPWLIPGVLLGVLLGGVDITGGGAIELGGDDVIGDPVCGTVDEGGAENGFDEGTGCELGGGENV